MDNSIIPLDIIVMHIARVRPGALWVCVSLCKAIYTALKPDLEHLQVGWLRCEEIQRKYRYNPRTIYKHTRWVNPNGSYHGEFKIMEQCADGAEKLLFIGNFKNGVPHGHFVKYGNTTKLLDATYIDGKLHGEHTITEWKHNKPFFVITNYHHGKKNGRCIKKYEDMIIHEYNYDMNLKHGREMKWWENGAKKYSCEWIRGFKQGWEYHYNSYGEPFRSILYHKSREVIDFDDDIAVMMRYT